MDIIAELIRYAALLISFSYLYGRMYRLIQFDSPWLKQLANGLVFSIMGVLSIAFPLEPAGGISIDARIFIVAYSGLFGGPVSSLVTALSCGLFGHFFGMPSLRGEIAAVLMGLALGFLLRHMHDRKRFFRNQILFASSGAVAALGSLAAILIFQSSEFPRLFESVSFPSFLLFYTFIGYFSGILINREVNQVLLEEDLKRGNERKRKALSIANDGYFDWDLRDDRIYLDSNFYRMAGYEPGDFPGTGEEWKRRIHSDDLARVERDLRSFLDGKDLKYDNDYRFLRQEGDWMWVHARAVALERDEEGKILRFLGTHSDITKSKTAQLELKLLQSAIEQAAEAILITDSKGNIQYVNPSFTKMTGYSRGDVEGKNPRILKSGEHGPGFYRDMWQTISEGKSWSGQIRNRRKDGSLYIEEIVISPVTGEENRKIVNYVAIKRDITGDLDLQEQIEQSRKMQAIGQLAGGVAHDFNNMLTGIMTATLMLKKKMVADELSLKYLSIIDEAVQRSADLTQNLLSFSRKQPQLLNIIDLHDSIGKTVKLLRSTLDKSIALNVELCDDKCPIIGDASQIENAILNLCINASHAVSGEGRIGISTEIVRFDRQRCERDPFDLEEGRYIHLAIEDNGTGMDAELLNKIFEPFFTTRKKSKGTGLGLTAVYAMIQQHKGSISVESVPGEGTVFHLYFYMIDMSGETEVTERQIVPEYRAEGCILLVDDEKLISGPLKDMLTDAGYKVMVAENGNEALDIFSEKRNCIDLVILDVIMPGMDGLACLAALREISPEIPVIVESGYSSMDKINRMREIGIQGFIKKPAAEGEIRRAIAEVLSARREQLLIQE